MKPSALLLFLLAGVALLCAQNSTEWPAYGHDGGGTRFSPLAQINRDNVTHLAVAWTIHTGDFSGPKWPYEKKSAFEDTPIVAGGTMFVCTAFDRVLALDPATGATRWAFDPKIDRTRNYGDGFICRGVSVWPAAADHAAVPQRIYVATLDARLIALDAVSGAPVAGFGAHGTVDLSQGIVELNPGEYHMTSAPAVIGDTIVVGSAIDDNGRVNMPSGVVRAYDARTGTLRWKWDPIPRDPADPARKTWPGDSATQTGAANAWSTISVDPARGLVFVPTGSASPDYYGGLRKGANLYADSVVALHAASGKVAWAFQFEHHDLWDYDVSSQPSLLDLPRDGHPVPAVLATNKTGNLYFLDRETGKPLFPVEERPVPQSDVPGEQTSPTQPFPTTPALVPQHLSAADAWGLNASDRAWCRQTMSGLRAEGIFTPPSLRGSLVFPGHIGGVAWGGAAVDARDGLVFLNTNRLAALIRLVPRAQLAAYEQAHPNVEIGGQRGSPYALSREFLLSPSRTPCNPPPWGTLTAVEIATGKIRWETPVGSWPFPKPQATAWGGINLAGPMATAGGLVFDASTTDKLLRAFDAQTGKLLWAGALPFTSPATPMTYLAPNGRQYVVIASGGHGKLSTELGDALVAFALPE